MTHTCLCLIEVGLLSIGPSNSIYSSKLWNNSLKSVLCSFYHRSWSVTAADLWGNAPHSCVAIRKVSFRGILYSGQFASELITSYSSNWIRLLLLCTIAPLVLCCDRFDRGSRQVKRDPVDLVTVDYDVTLRYWIQYTTSNEVLLFKECPIHLEGNFEISVHPACMLLF